MGAGVSAVDGRDLEATRARDEELLEADGRIFDPGFVIAHTQGYKPPEAQAVHVQTEANCAALGLGVDEDAGRVQAVADLMQTIDAIADEAMADQFAAEQQRLMFLHYEMLQAFQRQGIRDRNLGQKTSVQVKRVMDSKPRLATSTKLGLQSVVRLLLILIDMARRSDKSLISQILKMASTLVSETPVLSLSDDSVFSSDIVDVIGPIIHFVRDVAVGTDMGSSDDTSKLAVEAILGFAMARGSLSLLLSVVNILLDGCLERRQREYNFGHLLRALHTYQPVPRSEVGDDAAVVALASAVSHIEIIDGNSEASDNARNGRSSTVRPPMSSVGLHSTDAPSNLDREEQEFQRLDGPRVVDWPSLSNVCEIDAVLIIMSELDRLCCCVSPSSMSDLSRSLPDDATCQGRGVVQHPLCLDVSAATFTELSLILEKCNVRVFSGGIPDHDRTVYLRVVRYAIRLLKLHLFQQAKSGIPREALGVAKEDMIRLRKQVLRHVDRSADSAGKSSLSVIADEATQAFAIGLQFFCSSAHEQIVYLTDLLDKRVANYARGQYAKDLPDSAHPENNLLNMLLSRFSSVHAAIALIEDTRNERESLRKVVSSLLSLCVTSAVSLDAKAEQTCRTSAQPGQREALRILQNLQKALLGLSGKRHYDAAICYRYGDHPLPELGIVCEYAELAFRSAESVLVKVLLELEQFSGTDPQSFYLHRFSGLQQTLIGQLVRPLCCGLLALIHVNLPKLSSCIIHVLAGCLRAADRICSFLDGQGCLHSVSIVSEKRVVETEHPLPRNMDRQFRLSIPYASSLSLAFDSRSCTSSSDDFVQLLTSSHNAFVPVTERIWGPNVQPQFAVDSAAAASLWPSEPLKVSGDTVIVHVKTGDSSDASPATSGWGVSVTATASVETKPLAWFLDLSKTMANLLSVCGDTLIGTKIKTTAEDANCQWLSGLLFGGLRTSLSISSEDFAHSIPEISQVIYDLATNSNGEDACSLLDQEFEFVEQQVLKLVGRSGLNLPSDLDRLCFAVALHHCGITDMLRKDFNDCELLASDTGVLHLRLSEVHGSTGTIVDLLHDISRHSSRVSEQISKFAAQCDAGSDAGSVIARCKERLRFLLRVHPSPKNCVFTRENGSFREKEIPEGYAPFKSSSIVSSWDAVVIRCFNEVSAFVFDLENDLCAVHECLCVRHVRGFNRLLGLHVISNMISELHTDDLVTDVLRQVRFRCPTSDIVPSGESPDSSAISRLGRSSSRHPSDAIRAILSRSVAGWQSRRFPQTLADLARACAAHDADTVPALLTLENFPLLLPTGIPGFPHRPAPNESPSDVPEVLSLRQPVDVSTSEAGDNIASAESSSMKPSSAICLATVVEQNSSAHYLYGLDGCEIKMRGAVRDCFFSVISQLVGRPRKTAQQYLKLMDLCTFPYCGRDLDHLLRTGIVDSLSPLLAYPACNAGILGVPKGLSDLLREGRLRLMPWNVRFCAWSLFRVLLYVSCTQTKPTSAIDIGLGQVDSSSMGILVGKVAEQVNLLCVMRSFEVNAASGDIKNAFQYHREIARNNGNDLMMDKTGSAPDAYVWQCHTCTFINGIQWNACRACGSPPSAMSYNGQTGAHNTSSSRSVFTEFCYESDFDENGVVFALGTNNITGPRASNVTFKNPAETGAVKIRYASLAATSVPATAIVGRTAVRCVSAAAENQWFIVDFLGRLIRPTYYTLRHYSSYNVEALRSWRLEGSSDGVRIIFRNQLWKSAGDGLGYSSKASAVIECASELAHPPES
ncbi:unnamed protein product (mitochondrion) [Plasmodiophora brassicae]|uniref:RanBP2-type domain-containing protein n=1 Tax=Plasmodiophora brassicae TaxID=37360 RepID=A0A3P3Y7P5_PLABS|nr:unnamed protein product [Plasmodiophora brassicae]